MANECKIKESEVDRMAKNPGLAKEYVQNRVYSQREVDACSADKPSAFDKLKGMLGGAFEKAGQAVQPLDNAVGQAVKVGVGVVVDETIDNSGGSGRTAEAIQTRPEQLKSLVEYNR